MTRSAPKVTPHSLVRNGKSNLHKFYVTRFTILGADDLVDHIQHVGIISIQPKGLRADIPCVRSLGTIGLESLRTGPSRMKTYALVFALILGSAIGAETNAPVVRLVPLEGPPVAVDTAPRGDAEQYNTDGMTKTQFLVLCERHVVHYVVDGKMHVFTNMIATTNFIKRVVPLDIRKTTGEPAIPPMPP